MSIKFNDMTAADFTSLQWYTGKTLIVDGTNGNNTKAARGKPMAFATLTAAKTAAQSGDLIIVYPGTYAERDLLKNGVNWHFLDGAIVSYTDPNTGTGRGIFDDRGGAVTCSVTGRGVFKFTCFRNANANVLGAINITNASTTFGFEAKRVEYDSDGANSSGAFWIQDCTRCDIDVDEIVDPWRGISRTDPTDPEATYVPSSTGLYWEKGETYFTCRSIKTSWYGIYAYDPIGNVTPQNLWARVDYIESDGAALYTSGQTLTYRVWLEALQLKSGTSAVLLYSSGRIYVTAQKVESTNSSSGTIELQGTATMEAWVSSQKITNSGGGPAIKSLAGTGTVKAWFRADHIEATVAAASMISIAANGGLIFLHGAYAKNVNGKGIVKTGTQELRAVGLTIDTATTNAAGNNPVSVSASGLVLDGCVLVAPALAESITAGSAQTVKIYGETFANTDPSANIDWSVGQLTVDPLVT
jgi:hypothetical protein